MDFADEFSDYGSPGRERVESSISNVDDLIKIQEKDLTYLYDNLLTIKQEEEEENLSSEEDDDEMSSDASFHLKEEDSYKHTGVENSIEVEIGGKPFEDPKISCIEEMSLNSESIAFRAKKLKRLIENLQNLDETLLESHSEPELQCPNCSYRTRFGNKFIEHFKIHSSIKKWNCPNCTYKTNKKKYLNQHKLIHLERKPYICMECDYQTHIKGSLKQHMATHLESKQYNCHFCNYKASRKWNLTQHLLTHEDSSKRNKFACDLCDYKTNIKSSFNKHLRNHSQGKRFKCPECDYKTYVKGSLGQHMMVHSKEKRYSCPQCSYKTNRNWSLRKHIKIHVEIKEHGHGECDYRGATIHNLKTHNTMFHLSNSKSDCVYSFLSNGRNELSFEDYLENAEGPSHIVVSNPHSEVEEIRVEYPINSENPLINNHTDNNSHIVHAEYPFTIKKETIHYANLNTDTSPRTTLKLHDSLIPPVGLCKIQITERDNSAIAWTTIGP